MKTIVRGINGNYNVTINGSLKVGAMIQTTDKDGYYVEGFSGIVTAIIENAITLDNGRNTVTSGSYKLNGATIEVLN